MRTPVPGAPSPAGVPTSGVSSATARWATQRSRSPVAFSTGPPLHRHRRLPLQARHRVGLHRRHHVRLHRHHRTAPTASHQRADGIVLARALKLTGPPPTPSPTTRPVPTSPTSTSSPKPASPPAVPGKHVPRAWCLREQMASFLARPSSSQARPPTPSPTTSRASTSPTSTSSPRPAWPPAAGPASTAPRQRHPGQMAAFLHRPSGRRGRGEAEGARRGPTARPCRRRVERPHRPRRGRRYSGITAARDGK